MHTPLLKEAYFFDLDGTLIDTTADIATAVNLTRAFYDLPPLSLEEVEAGVGWGATDLIRKTFPSSLNATVMEIRNRFVQHYHAHLCDQTCLYPLVREVLDLLKAQKRPLALVTNKPLHLTTPTLEHLKLTEYFQSVVCGDTFTERKPHPRPLLESLIRLNLQADQVLFVGDTEVDLEAGQRAGIDVGIVPYGRAVDQSPFPFNWELLLQTLTSDLDVK